nr:molecular chaperone TorD family protein [uncultured Desulfobulbus sp.]
MFTPPSCRTASILTIDEQTAMPPHTPHRDQEDAFATEAATLSSLYSFLSLTMRYPEPVFCDTSLFDALESLLASLDWPEDLASFQSWRAQSPNPVDELRTEYTRLFITAARQKTLPLYASVHADGDGTLQGKTTERTRDFYREHGYDIANDTEPADHISFELDFLAALAGEAKLDDEDMFLRTLFRPWFERFLEKWNKEARHPYYAVSIRLIDFFTKEEQ